MPPEPKMTLIEFLAAIHRQPGWQNWYADHKSAPKPDDQWTKLVTRVLEPDDAQLVLNENAGGIEAKVNAEKTPAQIVWTAATVWQ